MPHGDLQLLEQQLETARRDQAQGDVVRLLERQLEEVRRDQANLIRQFAHQHSRTLRVLAARLVGHNDAEDVAQEAFVNLTRRIQAKPLPEVMALLRSTEDLLKLMYKITACRAYDHLRRSRRDDLTEDGGEIESAVDRMSLPRPQAALEVVRLERAYATLPPAQRIAHVLHYYYGFTDADFEATLGFTKSNSRTLVHRANLALKRAMEMKQ